MKKKKALFMETKLAPIFRIRLICIKELNPEFYKKNYRAIIRSSLAAQDYIFSGNHEKIDTEILTAPFCQLPGYMELRRKYNLSYSMNIGNNIINPLLISELSDCFKKDLEKGIITMKGEIKNHSMVQNSELLKVCHNKKENRIPVDAFRKKTFEQMTSRKVNRLQQVEY